MGGQVGYVIQLCATEDVLSFCLHFPTVSLLLCASEPQAEGSGWVSSSVSPLYSIVHTHTHTHTHSSYI